MRRMDDASRETGAARRQPPQGDGATVTDDFLFFLAALAYLLAELLYAWGPPPWFAAFPYRSGLRFLLALEAYFLGSALFLALYRGRRRPAAGALGFAIPFALSFAVVPAFAALVLLGYPLQALKTFLEAAGAASWLLASIVAFRGGMKARASLSAIFLVTACALPVRSIPSALVIAARLIALAAVSCLTVRRAQRAADYRPVMAETRPPFDPTEIAAEYALSARETEVLSLLLSGRTNGEIAEALFVSLSTVKTHVASILAKTGARNRLALSAMCKKP